MFEVRPIGARTKFKPVKEPETEIPSVELITELVEVQLEEFRFYVMVSVQYAPFSIADGNMHPRQDLAHFFLVVHDHDMVGGHIAVLFNGRVTVVSIGSHIGTPIRTFFYFVSQGRGLEVADDLHLYMSDSLGCTILLIRRGLRQTALGHDKHGGLALAATSAFQRAILLFFGRFRGEETLVNLHVSMKRVAFVTLAHHITQLMHHLPYGLITLATNLALYLLGGYGTLCRRQEKHGRKPLTHRQMAALHHRTGTKLHLVLAIQACPGLVARIPTQAQTATLTTEQTVMLTETAKGFLTGCFVRVLMVKIK